MITAQVSHEEFTDSENPELFQGDSKSGSFQVDLGLGTWAFLVGVAFDARTSSGTDLLFFRHVTGARYLSASSPQLATTKAFRDSSLLCGPSSATQAIEEPASTSPVAMPPKGNSRSARARSNQPSSPPKTSRDQQSPSPVTRRTRSTRSQSAEQHDLPPTRRGPKRTTRQASEESVESNPVVKPSSRKITGRTRSARSIIEPKELQTVAEDEEDEEVKSDEDEEGARAVESMATGQDPHSPGGLSEMSGTTAITSQSVADLAELDTIAIAEGLPSLYKSSRSVLNLLAPTRATTQDVERIYRDLKVLGSRTAKRLKKEEEKFQTDKRDFGPDDYIRTTLICQGLFKTKEPHEGDFRPDAVIHAANLATLVNKFLVVQRENANTMNLLIELDTGFPVNFLGSFSDHTSFGASLLIEESFGLALDIRTQIAIVRLGLYKDDSNWNPDQILSLAVEEWRPKGFKTSGSAAWGSRIEERAQLINSTFRHGSAAHQASDLVDFEALDEMFPWLDFITTMVKWSRARLAEIFEAVEQQGGIQNITQSIVDVMRSLDRNTSVIYNPTPFASQEVSQKGFPRPPVDLNSSKSLYRGKDTLNLIKKITASSSASSKAESTQPQPHPNRSGPSKLNIASLPDKVKDSQPDQNDFRPVVDDDVEEEPVVEKPTSSDRPNKNQPKLNTTAKKSLLDQQAGARRVQWDSQESNDAGPSAQPGQDDLLSESEDLGYEEDRRVPDAARRAQAPPAQRYRKEQEKSSKKRAREHSEHDSDIEEGASPPQRQRTQSSARPQARPQARPARINHPLNDDDDDDDEEDEQDVPSSNLDQVIIAARVNGVKSRLGPSRPKKRIPWDAADSRYLERQIGEIGCSWAALSRLPGWKHPRDQGAIKDRARNMKVNYLEAGVPLPPGWENVALGKKEQDRVRKVDGNEDWEPDWQT